MKTLPHHPQRGSVLITVLILAAIVAISLTSYLSLTTTAARLSNRTYLGNVCMNLAETGLEQAVWSFNQDTSGITTAWDGWTIDGTNATRKWKEYSYGANTTGEVRVFIRNYKPAGSVQPVVLSESFVYPASGAPIKRMVQVILRRRTLFALGLVAKETIKFSGTNATVDSWNSDPDDDPTTGAIAYDSSVRNPNGSAGSMAVSIGSLGVGNADIFGYASIGTSDMTGLNVGPQGKVTDDFSAASGTVDYSRVTTDFSINLEEPVAPTGSIENTILPIDNTTTLPGAFDLKASDGKYYYNVPGISLNNRSLNFSGGDVVVKIISGYDISIGGGSGAVNVSTGASAAIYCAGDIKIAGNGIMNGGTTTATAQPPINFQIWGTAPAGSDQDIQIAGNGVLSGVVYAPNADITINGNGDVMGSVVGDTINVTGNASFHYDESLANFGANNPFGITRWVEITNASDRAAFEAYLNF